MLLLLLACQDYGLNHNNKNEGTKSITNRRDDTGGGPLPFPCTEEGVMALDVPVDENCKANHQTGSLETVVEWSIDRFGDYPDYSQVLTVPVVGNMTDDNEDGVIDTNDIPDIVMMGDDGAPPYNHGAIHIIRGDGDQSLPAIYMGITDQFQVYPYRYASIAIGDIDNDHIPDIVTIAELVAGGPPDWGIPEEIPFLPNLGVATQSPMTRAPRKCRSIVILLPGAPLRTRPAGWWHFL